MAWLVGYRHAQYLVHRRGELPRRSLDPRPGYVGPDRGLSPGKGRVSTSCANVVIFNVFKKHSGSDLWTLSISGDRTPRVFVNSKHAELNGTFSPDGRWVAYQSNASGRYEVVVRPSPTREPAQTISRDGGRHPRWRGDGKELFFLSPDGTMVAAGFDPKGGALVGEPQRLFPTQLVDSNNRPYAVDKNGERFLLPIFPDPRLIAVMDWRALLSR